MIKKNPIPNQTTNGGEMTAKEFYEKESPYLWNSDDTQKDEGFYGKDDMIKFANQYALHIAERAVKDENEFWLGDSSGLINRTCNNILFRIKKLTND